MILANSVGSLEREVASLRTLLARQVDGIELCPVGTGGDELLRSLSAVPVVVVDRKSPDAKADAVLVDDLQGGYLVTQRFLALGHRRIGYISGPEAVSLTAYAQPSLTTDAQPVTEVGRLAAQCLVGRTARSDLPSQPHVLPTRLVLRESSALPALRIPAR